MLSSIDSAGIPTGGAPDIALVLLAPDLTWAEVAIHVLATVLGSTTGCVVLYAIGRRGIQLLLNRGSLRCYKNAIKNFRSLGHWAVFGGVLGPPPFPTKRPSAEERVQNEVRKSSSISSRRVP